MNGLLSYVFTTSRRLNAISLVLTFVALVGIDFATNKTYGCGFEGCMWTAGFPLNYMAPDGVGASTMSYFPFLLNAVLLFVIFSIVVIFVNRLFKKQ